MPPTIDLQIREQLARYLSEESSLQSFQEWFAPILWDIEKYGNPSAEELAYEIEQRLAEFSHGDWTEEELRRLLRPLVASYRTVFAIAIDPRPQIAAALGASDIVTRHVMTFQRSGAGRLSAVVSE